MNKLLGLFLILLFIPAISRLGMVSADFEIHCSPAVNAPVIASYVNGTHWIAGETFLREGSDTVYQLGNGNVLQCFCPVEKSQPGIETHWVSAAEMSEREIQARLKTGWILVKNGADFGLSEHTYLAFNQPSVCSVPTPTPSCTPTPSAPISAPIPAPIIETTPTPSPTSSSTSNATNASGQGSIDTAAASTIAKGEVLAVSTAPKTLAFTGASHDFEFITSIFLALAFLSSGIYLSWNRK